MVIGRLLGTPRIAGLGRNLLDCGQAAMKRQNLLRIQPQRLIPLECLNRLHRFAFSLNCIPRSTASCDFPNLSSLLCFPILRRIA